LDRTNSAQPQIAFLGETVGSNIDDSRQRHATVHVAGKAVEVPSTVGRDKVNQEREANDDTIERFSDGVCSAPILNSTSQAHRGAGGEPGLVGTRTWTAVGGQGGRAKHQSPHSMPFTWRRTTKTRRTSAVRSDTNPSIPRAPLAAPNLNWLLPLPTACPPSLRPKERPPARNAPLGSTP
jgi:hypothetical protein